ncbi:hypothetical protein [Halopelagius longus]|uniref:Uncharacterized protein n=1 Tax=Halopelagius longus TaxID=1236180 RepID=A0A1H1GL90_9EURY|nr:hypothetical protein [Halopelagius longus]SDR13992.1 hypothetical protein SAMN05216278_3748 [Halopelagius longus]
MEFPELTSPDGAFTYLMAAIIAVALVIAVYIVAVYAGVAPAV